MKDLDLLIKEVALDHDILLRKHDPALIFASINEKLLCHYAKQLSADQIEQQKNLAIVIERQAETSKEAATMIITKAATSIRDQTMSTTRQAADLLAEIVSGKVKAEATTLTHDLERIGGAFIRKLQITQWALIGMAMLAVFFVGMFIGMHI